MRIAGIVLRTLMGLLFLFSSIPYFFNLMEPPELEGAMKTLVDGMVASGFLLTLVKLVELVCGVAFVIGRFVPLTTVIIAPVIVNILLVHIFIDATTLPVAIFLVVANSFVAYQNWDAYKPLLRM